MNLFANLAQFKCLAPSFGEAVTLIWKLIAIINGLKALIKGLLAGREKPKPKIELILPIRSEFDGYAGDAGVYA